MKKITTEKNLHFSEKIFKVCENFHKLFSETFFIFFEKYFTRLWKKSQLKKCKIFYVKNFHKKILDKLRFLCTTPNFVKKFTSKILHETIYIFYERNFHENEKIYILHENCYIFLKLFYIILCKNFHFFVTNFQKFWNILHFIWKNLHNYESFLHFYENNFHISCNNLHF